MIEDRKEVKLLEPKDIKVEEIEKPLISGNNLFFINKGSSIDVISRQSK